MTTTWERQTLDSLRHESQKRLAELRQATGWTSEGPWKMVMELGASASAHNLTLEHDSDFEGSQHSEQSSAFSSVSSEDVSSAGGFVVRFEGKAPAGGKIPRRSATETLSSKKDRQAQFLEVGTEFAGRIRRNSPQATSNAPSKEKLRRISSSEILGGREYRLKHAGMRRGSAQIATSRIAPWTEPDMNWDDDESGHFSWAQCLRFFRWGQMKKIADAFHDEMEESGGSKKDADSFQFMGRDGLRRVMITCIHDCFPIKNVEECVPNVIEPALKVVENAQEMYSFNDLVRAVSAAVVDYQDKHPTAGFDWNDRKRIETAFEASVGEEVRDVPPTKVFGILGRLGVEVSTIEQQSKIITLCDVCDDDKSGTIDFVEFLHLYRRITRFEEYDRRDTELLGLTDSGFSNEDIEGFRDIFDTGADDTGYRSSIPVQHLLGHFAKVGVSFNRDDKIHVFKWIQTVDKDFDGGLDFGEFCMLMQLIWHTNLGNVKQISEQKAAEKSAESLKRAVTNGDLGNADDGEKEYFRRSWVALALEARKHETLIAACGSELQSENEDGRKHSSRRRPSASTDRERPTRRMSINMMQMCAGIGDAPPLEQMLASQQAV